MRNVYLELIDYLEDESEWWLRGNVELEDDTQRENIAKTGSDVGGKPVVLILHKTNYTAIPTW